MTNKPKTNTILQQYNHKENESSLNHKYLFAFFNKETNIFSLQHILQIINRKSAQNKPDQNNNNRKQYRRQTTLLSSATSTACTNTLCRLTPLNISFHSSILQAHTRSHCHKINRIPH